MIVKIHNKLISLVVNHGVNTGKEYVFNSDIQRIIRIGRKKTSSVDIDFNDDATSRLQFWYFFIKK